MLHSPDSVATMKCSRGFCPATPPSSSSHEALRALTALSTEGKLHFEDIAANTTGGFLVNLSAPCDCLQLSADRCTLLRSVWSWQFEDSPGDWIQLGHDVMDRLNSFLWRLTSKLTIKPTIVAVGSANGTSATAASATSSSTASATSSTSAGAPVVSSAASSASSSSSSSSSDTSLKDTPVSIEDALGGVVELENFEFCYTTRRQAYRFAWKTHKQKNVATNYVRALRLVFLYTSLCFLLLVDLWGCRTRVSVRSRFRALRQ